MRIDRLISIVVILLERDLVPASELARRFSVTVRTIQRDMEALNLAGIPVYAQAGMAGGYGIMPEYKLGNRLASDEDFLGLLTALKGVQGTFADQRFLGALEKVYSFLPRGLRERADELDRSLILDFSASAKDSALEERLRVLERAIRLRRLVSCRYTSHREGEVSRELEPMTLILQWGAWYLFAYCRLRSDYRLFRVSRMRELAIRDAAFSRRPLGYREFIAERPDFRNDRLVELVFVAEPSARAFLEERHPEGELEYRADGSILARCRRPEEESLYRYLLSYGDSIEVLEPARVRERLKSLAAGVAKKYE
ncbi:MAG TPA: YafY family protein [Spirochaetia bacterium]|nr:YafY family protein [Spirochaetia bacterium]